jgi:uncharacterized damage-inducible protein DinB
VTDHILESARHLVGKSLKELRASVDGLPAEALNWRPTPETNSVAVLIAHTMGATRLWLRMAMGLPLPERDRDSEFRATFGDPSELLRFVDEMARDCTAALDSTDSVDWSAMRETAGRGGDAPPQVAAAYALIHVTEHLRGHVDQISLVRQLWSGRHTS